MNLKEHWDRIDPELKNIVINGLKARYGRDSRTGERIRFRGVATPEFRSLAMLGDRVISTYITAKKIKLNLNHSNAFPDGNELTSYIRNLENKYNMVAIINRNPFLKELFDVSDPKKMTKAELHDIADKFEVFIVAVLYRRIANFQNDITITEEDIAILDEIFEPSYM